MYINNYRLPWKVCIWTSLLVSLPTCRASSRSVHCTLTYLYITDCHGRSASEHPSWYLLPHVAPHQDLYTIHTTHCTLTYLYITDCHGRSASEHPSWYLLPHVAPHQDLYTIHTTHCTLTYLYITDCHGRSASEHPSWYLLPHVTSHQDLYTVHTTHCTLTYLYNYRLLWKVCVWTSLLVSLPTCRASSRSAWTRSRESDPNSTWSSRSWRNSNRNRSKAWNSKSSLSVCVLFSRYWQGLFTCVKRLLSSCYISHITRYKKRKVSKSLICESQN